MRNVLVRVAAISAVVIALPGIASAWGPDNDPGHCTGTPFKPRPHVGKGPSVTSISPSGRRTATA